MKIIIFGKNGQVGSGLMTLLGQQHTVLGFDQAELDLRKTERIAPLIIDHEPDWVINASAYTAVDRAEQETVLADTVNHLAAEAMAKACKQLQCGFVHYSTDYVFDGEATQPYVETDSPNPQSVYGVTKLAGEVAVARAYPNTIILRTAWVYAKQGANFVNTMLRLAAERDEIGVVSDQFGSPTLAFDLAEGTVAIIEKTPVKEVEKVAGLYHATGAGETNWHDFAVQILALTGSDVRLKSIATKDYPTAAPRPRYSVLSNAKLARVFGVNLPDWQASLEKTLA